MSKIAPFEKHAPAYDAWFENNRFVYESELMAIKRQLPKKGEGVEIGVGSGQFAAAFKEACRVLKPGSHIIIGFIDKNSPIGILYKEHKNESKFYKKAPFYSVEEVTSNLKKAGFINLQFTQTIFRHLSAIKKLEQSKMGYGEGSFVVVKALKPKARGLKK